MGKKPLREVPEVLQRKRQLEGSWHSGNSIALGASLSAKLKPLEFAGACNIVDACDSLNNEPEKVPKAISKAGYCIVYTNRTKCYYVVYREDQREEVKTASEQRVKIAKLAHAGC